ncbi:MAG: DUF3108 domain-containing protein [Acidobacteriota bacterium]
MSFHKLARKIIFVIFAVAAISYGWKLYAYQQQRGGLTPPPKPGATKPSAASGPANQTSNSNSEGLPLRVGERLNYNVSWSDFATAGRVEMEVVERGIYFGQDSYQIRTKVESLGQARALFGDVDYQYTSYVSPQTALPHRLVSSVRQGKTQADETVIFDQSKQQATFSDESTLAIPQGTYDLPSLVYAMRLRGISEGSKQKFTAIFGKDVIEFEAICKGREQLVTQTGTYTAIQVKLYPKGKKFNDYRGYVWFSDDAQRLPLVIKIKFSIGEMRADLTSAIIAVPSAPPSVLGKALTDESGTPTLPQEGGKNTNGNKGALNQPSATATPMPNLPFVVGERLNYDIAWGSLASVGKASFEVRQQGLLGRNSVFEFYGEASTVGAARSLMNVNDQASSFATVESLLPLKTDIRLREGRRLKQTSAVYDSSTKTATLSNGTNVPLQPGTSDLLSLFYSIRSAELKLGASYKFPFLDANHRLQMIQVKAIKQESIGGPMGTRDTLQLDILTPEPSPILIAQVWVSNDARRLPLYFVTRTRFGELRFQMISAANTK